MDHVRSIVVVATLLAAGAAFSAAPLEGSYPEQPTATPGAGQIRAGAAADAARYNNPGSTGRIRGEDRPEFVQDFGQQGRTRIDVNADLMLWQPGGVFAARHGEASPVYGAH